MSSELRFVQLNGVVFQNEAKILALCVTCLLLEKIYDFLKYQYWSVPFVSLLLAHLGKICVKKHVSCTKNK